MQESCRSAFGFEDRIELFPSLVDQHSILTIFAGANNIEYIDQDRLSYHVVSGTPVLQNTC